MQMSVLNSKQPRVDSREEYLIFMLADYTALMKAVFNDDFENVAEICSAQPHFLDAPAGWNNSTPLMIAAQYNRVQIIDFLLEKRAKVNSKNAVGKYV